MRYGMDLDGVVANFGRAVIKAANSLWPGKMAEDFVPDNWDYVGTLTKEEWKLVWAVIKTTPRFWLGLEATTGASELRVGSTSKWGPNEDEIYFVTARTQTIGESPLVQSAIWLSCEGLWPRGGRSTVIPVAEAKHKKDLFRGLGLKYMLDDYAPTVQDLNEIEGMHAFVMDQPWNHYATELPRVFSVAEYLSTIRELEAQK